MEDHEHDVGDDPFDVEKLRATSLDAVAVEHVVFTVPVHRPHRREFFRVNPDPEYTLDWLVLERNDDIEREVYWVQPEFRAELLEELRLVRVFTCINKNGTVFLWPAKLPTENTSSRHWSESALMAAEEAKTKWVRLSGNTNLGAYELFRAQGDLGDPQWPEKPFSDLLRLAFGNGRLIDSLDHPALKSGEF